MSFHSSIADKFKRSALERDGSTSSIPKAIRDVVIHIACVAAENDYNYFLKTGEIAYNEPPPKEAADD